MKCIKQVINRDGRFFQAACPDVYSSLALASVSGNYLFSTRPFSVNGASAHSNGTSHVRPDISASASDLFQQETGDSTVDFSRVRGSVNAAVVDTLTKFSLLAKTPAPSVDYGKAFKKILYDMRGMPAVLADNRSVLEELAKQHAATKVFERTYRQVQNPDAAISSQPLVDTSKVLNADSLITWGDRFDVHDVAAAAIFAGKILGTYTPPARLSRYSLAARVFTRVVQKISSAGYYFGM
jgi:hypothetical protein